MSLPYTYLLNQINAVVSASTMYCYLYHVVWLYTVKLCRIDNQVIPSFMTFAGGHRDRDRMVVGCAISAYHH